jgi:hypothetical protein
MQVLISKIVHLAIEDFYDIALKRHPALDEETVMKKVERLYSAMESLGKYAHIYPLARYKREWVKKGYKEFICEDFHFAYRIVENESGEEFALIEDACHSLLYHN